MNTAPETRSQPATLAVLKALAERQPDDTSIDKSNSELAEKWCDIIIAARALNQIVTRSPGRTLNQIVRRCDDVFAHSNLDAADRRLAHYFAVWATEESILRLQGLPPGAGLRRLRQFSRSKAVADFLIAELNRAATVLLPEMKGDNQ